MGPDRPIADIGSQDAVAWCDWLAERTGLPIRLPTEAEWEAAARAGSRTRFPWGNEEDDLSEYEWYDGNSFREAHAVGTRRSNDWGLHDLLGNVGEWCLDAWRPTYEGAPANGEPVKFADVSGPAPGHVIRGGAWHDRAAEVGSARRRPGAGREDPNTGFRPAFWLGPDQEDLVRPFLTTD
jgi:formylglycine-generating enzyme required for sulfatase activity